MDETDTNFDLPTADDDIALGMLETEIGYVLRRAQLAIFRRFFEDFRSETINPPQYSTLVVVENNPGIAQGRVASALGIKKTNFVVLVSGLEGRGLIERRLSTTDRRSQLLHLTEEGRVLMRRLDCIARDKEARIAARLGEEVYRGLFAPLRILAQGDF